jgi:hypothetical protein
MNRWIPVFGNQARRVQDEKWACTKCGAIALSGHEEGPPNGMCQCPKCLGGGGSSSESFRKNYDLINWG